jgi:hypothetical protein
MSKWVFADANHSVIKNVATGLSFEWPRHVHISNVHGHAAEAFRNQGCPWPLPYQADAPKAKPATPDDNARSRRREASELERNRRA